MSKFIDGINSKLNDLEKVLNYLYIEQHKVIKSLELDGDSHGDRYYKDKDILKKRKAERKVKVATYNTILKYLEERIVETSVLIAMLKHIV